jgi:hypothetical protein
MTEQTEPAQGARRGGSQAKDSAGIDFLDFLFTFTLGFGLVPEALGGEGPLSEGWFKGSYLTASDRDRILTLILGLLTLTLSWFGYHASIKRHPLDLAKLSGLLRFQLDVLLVLLYGLMLINYRSFDFVVGATLIVFVLFFVWDLAKAEELGQPYLRPQLSTGQPRTEYRREMVTMFWATLMLLASILYFAGLLPIRWWCIIAIGIGVLYRVHKIVPWRGLERRLGDKA